MGTRAEFRGQMWVIIISIVFIWIQIILVKSNNWNESDNMLICFANISDGVFQP